MIIPSLYWYYRSFARKILLFLKLPFLVEYEHTISSPSYLAFFIPSPLRQALYFVESSFCFIYCFSSFLLLEYVF